MAFRQRDCRLLPEAADKLMQAVREIAAGRRKLRVGRQMRRIEDEPQARFPEMPRRIRRQINGQPALIFPRCATRIFEKCDQKFFHGV